MVDPEMPFPLPTKDFDNLSGHLSVILTRTGYRIWSETAAVPGGGNWPFGNPRGSERRLAEELISALKEKINADAAPKKRRAGKYFAVELFLIHPRLVRLKKIY